MAAINERRKEFNQISNQTLQSNQRYHADEVEERFARYKPGVMRQELKTEIFMRLVSFHVIGLQKFRAVIALSFSTVRICCLLWELMATPSHL